MLISLKWLSQVASSSKGSIAEWHVSLVTVQGTLLPNMDTGALLEKDRWSQGPPQYAACSWLGVVQSPRRARGLRGRYAKDVGRGAAKQHGHNVLPDIYSIAGPSS